jgi:hypothetical protein
MPFALELKCQRFETQRRRNFVGTSCLYVYIYISRDFIIKVGF